MYLNCHSYHSLRYGTIPLNDLIQEARACNVIALALTDINTVTGIYDFIKGCEANGIKPLIGIEFRQNNTLLYIGIAKNRAGLGEMNRFLTKHNFENTPLPDSAPEFENVNIIYPLENVPNTLQLHEYIGIRYEQLPLLIRSEWQNRQNKMVVLQPVTYRVKKDYNLHRILRSIELNTILSKLTENDTCKKTEIMIPEEELKLKFKNHDLIVDNTQRFITVCNLNMISTHLRIKSTTQAVKKVT